MVAMSEIIDPVKIEGLVIPTKAQQRLLRQWHVERPLWVSPDDAVKLIRDYFPTTEGHAQKLLEDARNSREVQCHDRVLLDPDKPEKGPDPRHIYIYNKDDLLGWLARHPPLQSKPVTEQPEPLAKLTGHDKRKRAQDKRDWARKAIDELWPKGDPGPIAVPDKSFCDQVIVLLKADCDKRGIAWPGVSEKTILRARRGE
jgi:hypothetical protein